MSTDTTSSDIEKSFTANLKYNLSTIPDRPDLVSTNFSYLTTTTVGQTTVTGKGATTYTKNVDDIYLCVNTRAPESVELYFRYWTFSETRAYYVVWVRSGPYTGSPLCVTKAGSLFAGKDSEKNYISNIRLVQRDEANSWKPITVDKLDYAKKLLIQIETGSSYSNFGLVSRKTPDSSSPNDWYGYIHTGYEDDRWWLDNVNAGVDYAPTDIWGKAKP
jgi:hypothetical protein